MKNESKQQKTSISVMKRVFSIFIGMVILASVSVFATNTIYIMPHDSSTLIGTINGGECYISPITADSEFAAFATSNGQCYILSNYSSYFYQAYGGSLYQRLCNIGYSDIFYNKQITSLIPNTDTVTIVSDLDEAVSLFKDALNPTPPETGNTLNISLPAGNVAIIEMGTGSNPVELITTTADPYPTPNNNINGKAILQTDTLPSSVSSSMQGATYITWSGTGGTTINGWYYTWRNTFDQVFDYHKYMIVINPLYGISSGGTVANSRIDINVTKAVSYQIVPLDTEITSEGLVGNDSGVVYDGTYDPDSGEWSLVDEDGNPVEPTVGGGNIVQGTANTIHDFLQNIANEISGFFTGAIGAVNTLVNAVSNFAGTLKALYIWLPAPVYSVLTAAIILAITIGVIKVFI